MVVADFELDSENLDLDASCCSCQLQTEVVALVRCLVDVDRDHDLGHRLRCCCETVVAECEGCWQELRQGSRERCV